MARKLVRVVRVVPAPMVRRAARFFMRGRTRRRVFDAISTPIRNSGVIVRGPLAGYTLSDGYTAGYALGASEPEVQAKLLEILRPGDVFYDVGANIGFLSLLAAKIVGDTGRVVAFEPLTENVAKLEQNLQANGFANYEIVPLALADYCGTTEIVLDWALAAAGIRPAREGDITRTVDVATLDSLTLPAPDLVKIDVEGAESRVLRGMRRVIRDASPTLLIEIHDGQDQPVRDALADLGYSAVQINSEGMPHVLATPLAAVPA